MHRTALEGNDEYEYKAMQANRCNACNRDVSKDTLGEYAKVEDDEWDFCEDLGKYVEYLRDIEQLHCLVESYDERGGMHQLYPWYIVRSDIPYMLPEAIFGHWTGEKRSPRYVDQLTSYFYDENQHCKYLCKVR